MDLLSFLPDFGNSILVLLAFVVALSVIVAIHEYGHYIVGRWSGIHAEVFSLGFGPVLWNRTDKRGTVWQIAAFPLGGYVRFLGDADAASGKDGEVMSTLTDAQKRRTMHGAPLWARTATVAAGPIFNFILSILVFASVFLARGQVGENLTVGELLDLPSSGYTLRVGDEVRAIAGVAVPSFKDGTAFNDFTRNLPIKTPLDYDVLRDGESVSVTGPYLYPPHVLSLAPQSSAYNIDMKVGDVITAINGTAISAFSELKTAVESSEGATLHLDVWRDGEIIAFDLTPRRVDEPQSEGGFVTYWRIGIGGGLAFAPATITPSVTNAVWGGVTQTGYILKGSISGLYHMITGAISSCNLSGPLGIAKTSGAMASQGAQSFIWFIGVLSAAIGMLNLFPIPMLDGGHLVFYAYEAVVGKPPRDSIVRVLMSMGLAIVLGLMVFGLTNDLFCP